MGFVHEEFPRRKYVPHKLIHQLLFLILRPPILIFVLVFCGWFFLTNILACSTCQLPCFRASGQKPKSRRVASVPENLALSYLFHRGGARIRTRAEDQAEKANERVSEVLVRFPFRSFECKEFKIMIRFSNRK